MPEVRHAENFMHSVMVFLLRPKEDNLRVVYDMIWKVTPSNIRWYCYEPFLKNGSKEAWNKLIECASSGEADPDLYHEFIRVSPYHGET